VRDRQQPQPACIHSREPLQLLHNELIDGLDFTLKAKMAYQAAKGMHFLHSSGIVHRDLKSLNLLLDSKWNVKVSDFGLTKFKTDLDKRRNRAGGHDALGSIHWMAPEVLTESPDVDFAQADVYSFGVILWELLTRQQPYYDMRYGPPSRFAADPDPA
jgi:serine/threonine protein kinase